MPEICGKLPLENSPQKVSLGDDYQYSIKGIDETIYKPDSGKALKMKEVLYVLGLKKNVLSILSLDKKGFRVAFIDGQVLMWPKGKSIEDVVVIGEEEGGLYKLKGHAETTFVHESTDSSELWHRRFAHINYKALPHVNKVVTGLPDMKIKHEGIFKDV